MERDQLFRAGALISHRTLGDVKTSPEPFFMDLRNAVLLLRAQCSHERNHIQAELPVGQCPSAFFLWPRWQVKA
jgi:hypothetical protein